MFLFPFSLFQSSCDRSHLSWETLGGVSTPRMRTTDLETTTTSSPANESQARLEKFILHAAAHEVVKTAKTNQDPQYAFTLHAVLIPNQLSA